MFVLLFLVTDTLPATPSLIMPVGAEQHRASVGANNVGLSIALSRLVAMRKAARENNEDILVFLFSLVMSILTLGLWPILGGGELYNNMVH